MGPHGDYSSNRLRAKNFIDNLKREGFPGIEAYLSDMCFFIEVHRGKAKYSRPIALHQPTSELVKEVAEVLKICRQFVDLQGDKNV